MILSILGFADVSRLEPNTGAISLRGNWAELMVVGFNWAGKVREVSYPEYRNEDIEGQVWPGRAGGPIEQDHDRLLISSWWSSKFKNTMDL